MNTMESSANTNKNIVPDFLAVRDESESVIEKQFVLNDGNYSANSVSNQDDLPHSLQVETDDFNITIDEVKMVLGHSNVPDPVQTVKNDRLKIEVGDKCPVKYENTTGDGAKETDQRECIDKCDKNIKIEAVFFEEENRDIAASGALRVEIKPETKICENYNSGNHDNLGNDDSVNDETHGGNYVVFFCL